MSDFTIQVRAALVELGILDKNGHRVPGPVGPRGPAGDIDAAVHNSADAAMVAVKKSITYPFEEKIKELRGEFRDLKNDFRTFVDQGLEHSTTNNVVKVLQEYGVLDQEMNPINVQHLESHLKKIGVLEKS